MGNTYLVYLLQSQIHSVFSVFGGWRVEYTASVYFVYLFQGQIHSVFGVFASVDVCISHLGSNSIFPFNKFVLPASMVLLPNAGGLELCPATRVLAGARPR